MLTHLALNKKLIVAACLCATFMGAVYAKAPVILNNANLTDNYVRAGNHFSEVSTDTSFGITGHASDGGATQQSLTVDSNGVLYSAYLSTSDDKIYVLKFVNNQWVSAIGDADGYVAPGVYGDTVFGSSSVSVNGASVWTTNLSSTKLITGKDGNVYLAYIDYKSAEERTISESENNLRVLKLVVTDENSSWVAMPSLALQNLDIFDIGADDLEIDVDSQGNIYTLLNYVTDGANVSWFTNAISRVVELPAGSSSWSQIGGAITSEASQRNADRHFPGQIAISPSDELYLAIQTYEGVSGNGSVFFNVRKLATDDTWTDVGDQTELRELMTGMGTNTAKAWVSTPIAAMDISESGKVYVATFTRQNYLNVITYDPKEVEPSWKAPYDITSTRLNALASDYTGSNIYPPRYLDIEVNSNDIPYLSFYNPNRGTSPVEVISIREQFVDGEVVKAWIPLSIDSADMSSSNSTDVEPKYLNLELGYNDRPYLLYRDEKGDKHSRFLVAELENSEDIINFSITEQEFLAGELKIQMGYDDIFNPIDIADIELIWDVNGVHYNFFDPIALENGIITLNNIYTPNGANFRYPFLLLDVYAKQGDEFSHTKVDNGEAIPDFVTVRVNFQDSPDPDVIAAREFSFGAYGCEPDEDVDENTCTITMNENEALLFDFIQSKVQRFEIAGTLPDGLSFNVNDLDATNITADFSGNTTYLAAEDIDVPGVYEFTVTAYSTATSTSDTQSQAVKMTVNVVNVERDITVDYNLIADENSDYIIQPDSAVAVKNYSLVMDGGNISWIKLNELTGQLKYTPSFTSTGVYSGVVYAHGYDEAEPAALPFTIEVKNIPMFWDFENDPRYDESNNSLNTEISENVGFPNYIPTSTTGVQRFYVKAVQGETLPNFLTLNSVTGAISVRLGYEYESLEPYTFTIIAEGYDGEYKEVTHYVTVNHENSPPTIEAIQGPETEGLTPVLVDVLSQIYDVDSEQYGDQVLMVTDEGKWSHTGKGILTLVANGFIYAPHIPLTEAEARPVDSSAEDELITLYRPDEVENLTYLNSADYVLINFDGYAVDLLGQLILDVNGDFISPVLDDAGAVIDAITGLPLDNTNIVIISPITEKQVIIDDIVADLTTPDDGEVVITFTVTDGNFDGDEQVEVEGQVTVLVNAIYEENYKQSSSGGSFGNILALFALIQLVRVYKRKA
jgi:hypothetical protein